MIVKQLFINICYNMHFGLALSRGPVSKYRNIILETPSLDEFNVLINLAIEENIKFLRDNNLKNFKIRELKNYV